MGQISLSGSLFDLTECILETVLVVHIPVYDKGVAWSHRNNFRFQNPGSAIYSCDLGKTNLFKSSVSQNRH